MKPIGQSIKDIFSLRHSRESGNPCRNQLDFGPDELFSPAMDSRFRGNDDYVYGNNILQAITLLKPIFRLSALVIWFMAAPAAWSETPQGSRIFVEFFHDASEPELAAAKRWGAQWFAKAAAAGRPVRPNIARSESTTMISLESVAICDRARGCPLLVFRDIKARPVLDSFAFQNLILDYRDKETVLIITIWDKTTECRISNTLRARCTDIPQKR